MLPTSKNKPVILTIAANDSAGMAGIATDIKTQQAFGIHSAVAVTANTAQNNYEVLSVNPVDASVLKQQLEAVKELPIAVVKVGLVCNLEQVKVIADFIRSTGLPLILDPVLSSTSGEGFFPDKDIATYVDTLLPLSTLVTPNREETSLLTYLPASSAGEIELAADSMLLLGAKNILIKGGHGEDEACQDYFASDEKCFWLSSPRKNFKNTRGTGCAMASSIAACLTLGYSLYDSVVIGKMAINQGLREGYSVGEQKGPVAITRFPDQEVDLPILSDTSSVNLQSENFPCCNQIRLGLYPVVDRAVWLKKLLPVGVSTIQLRIKDLRGEALEREIKSAIELAEKYDCRLFINDYWELAIKHHAYGVHLGQEDLDSVDIDAIRNAGLRLGISTHCHYEVARAMQHKPSYIACGPVYHTNTKQMPWVPHGLDGLAYWRKVLDYPLVAIGGINRERLESVAEVGVDGVAMITAITEAAEPEAVAREMMALLNKSRYEKAIQ
ncbi:thiamine phosphate synthase [Aliikangiella coralliicola]|uniref:Thiamine-phosphate synthase n=1 Tax=Aliikangiella coralliicola TaxID=2592383 RepID=A0A545UHY0_9GAMM|nr:thiamine phosphate synthase [Aliikangiella coralliicola]TQV89084.1 thiamine phosphate synthase [Aliikangiella coralliicola]